MAHIIWALSYSCKLRTAKILLHFFSVLVAGYWFDHNGYKHSLILIFLTSAKNLLGTEIYLHC